MKTVWALLHGTIIIFIIVFKNSTTHSHFMELHSNSHSLWIRVDMFKSYINQLQTVDHIYNVLYLYTLLVQRDSFCC